MKSAIDIKNLIEESLLDEQIWNMLNEGGTPGVSSEARQKESIEQSKLLNYLADGDNLVIMAIIKKFGGLFREAIKEYRRKFKVVPTAKEILDFTNDALGHDVRIDVQELIRTIEDEK